MHADGYYGGWGNTCIGNPIVKSGGTTQTVTLGGTTVIWAESSGFTKIPNDMTITWVGALANGQRIGTERIEKAAVTGGSVPVNAAASAQQTTIGDAGPFVWITTDPFAPGPVF